MNIHFSAPSKTFLAGEYAVLNGGPALVINTEPRFTLTAKPGTGQLVGFPADGPAVKWLGTRKPLLAKWDLEFHDPHQGRGGFGASGAQFLFAHAFTTLAESTVKGALDGIDIRQLVEDYKDLAEGPASGADILAQSAGGVARVAAGSATQLAWPYPELNFAIVRTGFKVPTHEHLSKLELKPMRALMAPAIAVVERCGSAPAEEFLRALKNFSSELRELKLQAPKTLEMLADLEMQPWCKAAKGCGALGADTLLVIYAKADRPTVEKYFFARGLEVTACSGQVSGGLEMSWS